MDTGSPGREGIAGTAGTGSSLRLPVLTGTIRTMIATIAAGSTMKVTGDTMIVAASIIMMMTMIIIVDGG